MSPQLYLISPPKLDISSFHKDLGAALGAGDRLVRAFQLRLKEADDATIQHAVRALLPVCRDYEVAFILNDRPDLALDLGCDGVHLGQEDLEPMGGVTTIRKQLGSELTLGITCHASCHLAMEAGEAGADYVAFGAFYPTTSKPQEKLVKWGTPDTELLTWWQTYMTLPCVAIGGITPSNSAALAVAGADFLAVITAVWLHPAGPAAGVEAFKQALLVKNGKESYEN